MKNRLAQNKIDYIVYNNPENAAHLLGSFNHRPAKNLKQLARAVRELIKVEGRPAIEALVKIHPDRAAILHTEKKDMKCMVCKQATFENEPICSDCAGALSSEFDDFTDRKSTRLNSVTL